LKEEALDRTMWRNRFGGGFGPVVRQNTEWMNGWSHLHSNYHSTLVAKQSSAAMMRFYLIFGFLAPENGNDKLSLNVGNELSLLVA